MKIAIQTLPFNENYGGALQAYALQSLLKRMGHQVWTSGLPASANLYWRIKNFVWILLKKRKCVFKGLVAPKSAVYPFVKTHIRLIKPTQSHQKETTSRHKFEAYIVGSDQVWRPVYSPFLYNCFLDFTKDENVKRIAYAASFGVDQWEFTPEQTSHCAALLKKFDAVSVRETTAIQLCEEHFGVKATQALDPTLLLTKDDYLSLTKKNPPEKHEKEIAAYILDMNIDTRRIMNDVAGELQCTGKLITSYPLPHEKEWELYEYRHSLSVESWLSQISSADFIITDSFHGCVFAILFNKSFVAIENGRRGSTRFRSLLNLLDLQDRLVNSYDDFLCKKIQLTHKPIDYDRVNSVLDTKRNESLQFLAKALNNHPN